MQIEISGGTARWDLFQMDILRDFEDPESVEAILKTNAKAAFCISYHSYTLDELKNALKLMLERYGGWVGNDSNEFVPRFTLNDISSLSY
ncbi:hypothetical protein [Massilia sp. CCM 8734]|uniref:hypothetical protein n=1 Tax=Massilia sp. CCM 8734 TaxID=2609283 RepID=UPI001424912F|nr:hypothetical protein [Massilia sp. CCM 8734]NHZ98336.1 hypothetical protein [Massilia sp. CCM 8734]